MAQLLESVIDAGKGLKLAKLEGDAAFFWAKFYAPPTMTRPYVTDDPKMSAFDGDLMEAKLGVFGEAFGLDGRWAGARFEGILDYIIQHNRFGNAVEAHVALTLPFSY